MKFLILAQIALVTLAFWGGGQFEKLAQPDLDFSDVPNAVIAHELMTRGESLDDVIENNPGMHFHPVEGAVLVEDVQLLVDGALLQNGVLLVLPAESHIPELSESEALDLIPEEEK